MKEKAKKGSELKLRVEFEPSRVGVESLANAYEELVPVARQLAQPAANRKTQFYHESDERKLGGAA